MPNLTAIYIKEILNKTIKPEESFKFIFSASQPMKNFAIGVTEDKIYVLSLSFFGAKPKNYFTIDFKEIEKIDFGETGVGQGELHIETQNKGYKFMTTNMLFGGDQQTTEAKKVYEYIKNKIKK